MNHQSNHHNDTSVFTRLESEVRSYCRNFPAIFTQAQESTLIDESGKRYLDFLSGAGALNYGHNNPLLRKELLDYIQNNGVTHGLDLYTTAKRSFLEAFEAHILIPRGMNHKVQFTGPTGTNAVEAALKLARKVTGRTNVISFTNGYHGMSIGALAATANPTKRSGGGIMLNGVSFMPYEGYFGSTIDAFEIMEHLLRRGGGIDAPAAFIVECVQGEGGLRSASQNWMQKVKELAHSMGALLIIDDIQAGCGRCGQFFSFEALSVEPDIVCLSKSLSGYGLPMSVNLIHPHLDIWNPGEHNGTFRGNNLAFVTSRAAIHHYWANPSFSSRLTKMALEFDLELNRIHNVVFSKTGFKMTLLGRGFMRGLDFGDGTVAASISKHAFNAGLILETCGVHGQVIKLLPPITITSEALSQGLSILESTLLSILLHPAREVALC